MFKMIIFCGCKLYDYKIGITPHGFFNDFNRFDLAANRSGPAPGFVVSQTDALSLSLNDDFA